MELPNYLWYNGEKEVKPALENIQEADNGTILFDFISDVTDGIGNIQLVSNPDDSRIYTIDGRLAGSSVESLPKGLYIINKKKVFIK
jgi:immune inhibitor A